MRILICDCTAVYQGRLAAELPRATRVIMLKADGSVLIHSDGGSYKPLNWMSPPCSVSVSTSGESTEFKVVNKAGEILTITVHEIHADYEHQLGLDPGLIKDGVESHLQKLLAENLDALAQGLTLIRREYPTAIGPVDILCKAAGGGSVAIEIKRRGEIDGVEQLTRYLDLLNRDPLLAPVTGIYAAQEIKPQAKTLAQDRGIVCVSVDYELLKGLDDPSLRLF
jgi:RecB family endonuclease NucS